MAGFPASIQEPATAEAVSCVAWYPLIHLGPDQLEEEFQILKGQRLTGYKIRKRWGQYLLPFS